MARETELQEKSLQAWGEVYLLTKEPYPGLNPGPTYGKILTAEQMRESQRDAKC